MRGNNTPNTLLRRATDGKTPYRLRERPMCRSLQIITSDLPISPKSKSATARQTRAIADLFLFSRLSREQNFPEPGAFPRPVPCALLRIVQHNMVCTVNEPRLRKVRRMREVWREKEPYKRVPSLPKVFSSHPSANFSKPIRLILREAFLGNSSATGTKRTIRL